jgi:hypothetical protein
VSDGPRAWWARPQVLVAALVLVGAAAFYLLARPPTVPLPAPVEAGNDAADPLATREVTLYRVADGLATPILREVPAPADPSARLEAVVAALREALVEAGDWPDALPAPSVYAVRVDRADAAVLDLPRRDVLLDVATQRTILDSIQRTLAEQGIERTAFLRDGAAVDAWLGSVLSESSLE